MPKARAKRTGKRCTDERFVILYTNKHQRIDMLAQYLGVTRQAVWHRAKRLGLNTTTRKTEHLTCLHCSEVFEHWPSQGDGKYCSKRCYFEHTSLHGVMSRTGQRQARSITGAKDGEVVHHINGDETDNNQNNLMVFPNHAAHNAFHKSGAAKELIEMVRDGRIKVKHKV